MPAPLILPLAISFPFVIVATCGLIVASLYFIIFDHCDMSMLQPLLAFAMVVFAALLHCGLMPWQLPLAVVVAIVIAAG